MEIKMPIKSQRNNKRNMFLLSSSIATPINNNKHTSLFNLKHSQKQIMKDTNDENVNHNVIINASSLSSTMNHNYNYNNTNIKSHRHTHHRNHIQLFHHEYNHTEELPLINKNNNVINCTNPFELSFGNNNNSNYHETNYSCSINRQQHKRITFKATPPKTFKLAISPLHKQYHKIKTFTKQNNNIFIFRKTLLPNTKHSTTRINNYLCSFAVNSFKGKKLNANDNKISIFLAIAKPKHYGVNKEWPQCSYFAIYSGLNGNECSCYLRDNLHNFIIKNENFPNQPQLAITNGFINAQRDYQMKCPSSSSGAYVVVVLTINECVYIARCGKMKVIISMNQGNFVKVIGNNNSSSSNNSNTSTFFGGGVYHLMNYPVIKKINTVNNKCDFILIGNAGLFDNTNTIKSYIEFAYNKLHNNNNKKQSNNNNDIHYTSATIVDEIMKGYVNRKSNISNSLSCLFLGFNEYEKQMHF